MLLPSQEFSAIRVKRALIFAKLPATGALKIGRDQVVLYVLGREPHSDIAQTLTT